ncbi:hypothetical protein MGL_3854 [Malassezia globosa CBS 7966]|uniref:Uncharacterized protein n=1 Tax=Malassezia globosa (strain ATCC MYA-4612 / CBS 7966) TaxID=425265 RepID=A8QAY6_MALGO|nr:uncharacterized protein MGL_3854 [Malassezia globosa CBS 7966]EDP41852.1 hypothetical protein MGL_3854 [Malassezia globosa CBS 7966]
MAGTTTCARYGAASLEIGFGHTDRSRRTARRSEASWFAYHSASTRASPAYTSLFALNRSRHEGRTSSSAAYTAASSSLAHAIFIANI